jgi:hypothetical protein
MIYNLNTNCHQTGVKQLIFIFFNFISSIIAWNLDTLNFRDGHGSGCSENSQHSKPINFDLITCVFACLRSEET